MSVLTVIVKTASSGFLVYVPAAELVGMDKFQAIWVAARSEWDMRVL